MSDVDIDDSKLPIDDSKLQIGDSKCATVAYECDIDVTQRHPGAATLKSNHSKSQERQGNIMRFECCSARMTLRDGAVTLVCHCGTLRIADLKLRIADLKFRIVDIDFRHGGRSVRSTIHRVVTSSRRFELVGRRVRSTI